MGKYFGTDGVRGIANVELTAELVYRLGRMGAYILTKSSSNPTIVVGRDTRISGELIEHALVAGILSIGVNVVKLGVISTPAVAYLTKKLHADAGIMISASHNPYLDNGIKFFGADGYKLLDAVELEIESLIDRHGDELPRPIGKEVGRVREKYEAKDIYAEYLKTTINNSLNNLKIVLDTANGSAYEIAPKIFKELGANVISINSKPDGININDRCGSTHPEELSKIVLENQADFGFAYDGDADRLIAIDETGHIIDGDYIMLICGQYLSEIKKLKDNTIVSTVMSNIGYYKAVEKLGLHSIETAVGDRYVIEAMRDKGLNLGGEQSGHIIFLDYNTTGDGILTSIQLANVIKEKGLSLSELSRGMTKYPQILENVYVADKSKYNNNARIDKVINEIKDKLGDEGRVLVRQSGTESLIRVMAEGPDLEILKEYIGEIASIVKVELS
ncbi:MAG: phosphoglucosamine mutase [Vulcanibacillus sp.]